MCHLNAYEDYKRRFLAGDSTVIAQQSGGKIAHGTNYLLISYFNQEVKVDLVTGEIDGKETLLSDTDKIIIWSYLINAKGLEPVGKWVGFAEMPGAQNHQQMFKRNTTEPLAQTFGADAEGFARAAAALGGQKVKLGDSGYVFQVFPKVLVAVSIYLDDEEFPANANLIFDVAIIEQLDAPNIYTLSTEIARKLCGFSCG
ncbi:MAG: DUF3786 domain-containing protein [Clostridia bacterium]|nr:DUF3786 domain-containing protein [Clostridia bacterium]